jgi:hypothetical protein
MGMGVMLESIIVVIVSGAVLWFGLLAAIWLIALPGNLIRDFKQSAQRSRDAARAVQLAADKAFAIKAHPRHITSDELDARIYEISEFFGFSGLRPARRDCRSRARPNDQIL